MRPTRIEGIIDMKGIVIVLLIIAASLVMVMVVFNARKKKRNQTKEEKQYGNQSNTEVGWNGELDKKAINSKYADLPRRCENIYKDYDLNSRVLSVEVDRGKVRMNEGDSGPACAMMNGGSSYDRDLYEISLDELMNIFGCETLDDFYIEMRRQFGFYDGMDRFHELLKENNVQFAAYAG